MEENRKGICLRHPYYPHLIILPVWDPEPAGPGGGVSSFGFSTLSPCRMTRSQRHCQGQVVQVCQDYVKVREEGKDGSVGCKLSRGRRE